VEVDANSFAAQICSCATTLAVPVIYAPRAIGTRSWRRESFTRHTSPRGMTSFPGCRVVNTRPFFFHNVEARGVFCCVGLQTDQRVHGARVCIGARCIRILNNRAYGLLMGNLTGAHPQPIRRPERYGLGIAIDHAACPAPTENGKTRASPETPQPAVDSTANCFDAWNSMVQTFVHAVLTLLISAQTPSTAREHIHARTLSTPPPTKAERFHFVSIRIKRFGGFPRYHLHGV